MATFDDLGALREMGFLSRDDTIVAAKKAINERLAQLDNFYKEVRERLHSIEKERAILFKLLDTYN